MNLKYLSTLRPCGFARKIPLKVTENAKDFLKYFKLKWDQYNNNRTHVKALQIKNNNRLQARNGGRATEI